MVGQRIARTGGLGSRSIAPNMASPAMQVQKMQGAGGAIPRGGSVQQPQQQSMDPSKLGGMLAYLGGNLPASAGETAFNAFATPAGQELANGALSGWLGGGALAPVSEIAGTYTAPALTGGMLGALGTAPEAAGTFAAAMPAMEAAAPIAEAATAAAAAETPAWLAALLAPIGL